MATPQRFRAKISLGWFRQVWVSLFTVSLTLVLFGAVIAQQTPAQTAPSMQVQAQPTNPQLGDTISVVSQASR